MEIRSLASLDLRKPFFSCVKHWRNKNFGELPKSERCEFGFAKGIDRIQ